MVKSLTHGKKKKKQIKVTDSLVCIHGHKFIFTKKTAMRLTHNPKDGSVLGILARCAVCKGTSPTSYKTVALVYGIIGNEDEIREKVLDLFKDVPQGTWREDIIDLGNVSVARPCSGEGKVETICDRCSVCGGTDEGTDDDGDESAEYGIISSCNVEVHHYESVEIRVRGSTMMCTGKEAWMVYQGLKKVFERRKKEEC